jgi:hypothetical protein
MVPARSGNLVKKLPANYYNMDKMLLSIHPVNYSTMKNHVVKRKRSNQDGSNKLSMLALLVITFGFIVYHVLNGIL